MQHQPKPLLLIFPFGLLSHYLRCLVLARHLSPYFKIRFAYHPAYSHFIEREGFTSFNCHTLNENDILENVKEFDFSWLNGQNLEAMFKSQVAVIQDLNPVAVLGDAMPTLKMAAEYTGVHYLSLINAYMSHYYAGKRSLSKTHFAYKYVSKLPAAVKDFITEQGEALAFKQVHLPFKKLREKYLLQPQHHYLNEIEGDQTLVCDLDGLFPLKDAPANFYRIGPLLYSNTIHDDTILPVPAPEKKTIYVSMGSSGNWEDVAFLNKKHYRKYNIIATGDSNNVLTAPHIIKQNFIDAAKVLPMADLVICHGGNGTLYQALSYGVPILCNATHFEQEWNVDALQKSGLALPLDTIGTQEKNIRLLIEEWANQKDLAVYKKVQELINGSFSQLSAKLAVIVNNINASDYELQDNPQDTEYYGH